MDFSSEFFNTNESTKITADEFSRNPKKINFTKTTENYLNEIKAIHDKEKDDLINQIIYYQQEIEEIKSFYTEKVANYENEIRALKSNHSLECEALSSQYEIQFKKRLAEKDQYIQGLLNEINGLNQTNDDLLKKLNAVTSSVNDYKLNYTNSISCLESENEKLQNDLDNIKKFYENKLAFMEKNFNDEKNQLIYSYDSTIQELKDNYNKSKTALQKIIEQREMDVKESLFSNKNDLDKANDINKEYKDKICKLNEENIRLNKEADGLKYQISQLEEDLKKSKKEAQMFYFEKAAIEQEKDNLIKKNTGLSLDNKQLHRITHGKLKRGLSKGKIKK